MSTMSNMIYQLRAQAWANRHCSWPGAQVMTDGATEIRRLCSRVDELEAQTAAQSVGPEQSLREKTHLRDLLVQAEAFVAAWTGVAGVDGPDIAKAIGAALRGELRGESL